MAARFLVAVALAPLALAFSNTVPVIAWASTSSSPLDALPSTVSTTFHSASFVETIFFDEAICQHDAIILIQQPGLHATDLRSLSPQSYVARALISSPSARQFPYVPISDQDVHSIVGNLATRCKSRLLNYTIGQGGVSLEENTKHIICLGMPHLVEYDGAARGDAMERLDSLLATELSTLASAFPDHMVIYSGLPLPLFVKRQSPDIGHASSSFAFVYANNTLSQGGILKRYQLLTPGLITILLLVFFILVPVVMVGMQALASIQTPIRVDLPKNFNAQERKNQ